MTEGEKVYINPEETLKFTENGGSYKVEMLPKHELYYTIRHKFGGSVEDPKCMDYNSWITSGVHVSKNSRLSNTQIYGESNNELNKGSIWVSDNSTLTDCIIEAGGCYLNRLKRCNLSGVKSSGSFGREAAGLEFRDVSMIGNILISTIGRGRLLRMNSVDARGILRLSLVQADKSKVEIIDSIFNGNIMLELDAESWDTDVHIKDCGFTGDLIVSVKENLENKWHK